jgi:hypothetical protein
MSNLVLHRAAPGPQTCAIALPEPRGGEIAVRVATLGGDDFAFIDALQKKHSHMVGFLKRPALQKHIELGRVLIAEESSGPEACGLSPEASSDLAVPLKPQVSGPKPVPVGYCLSQDRYFRRDDCGLVTQLNVVPTKQRGLIGATLIKEVFNRASYACKLFCCWCAQDLEANSFWESMGFVPLAFRTGSRARYRKDGTVSKPERIHIFWQRRIREGDETTPYWFPAETSAGLIGENRIALPIPPGTHWSDAKPAVLPGFDEKLLCHSREGGNPEASAGSPPSRGRRERAPKPAPVAVRPPSRGVWTAPPAPPKPTKEQLAAAKKEKARQKAPKKKNDPRLVAAARELSAKYLEQINAGLLLPPSANGKYDVSRQLEAAASTLKQTPLLKAA